MTTTNTGQGLVVADTEAPHLDMRQRRTRWQKLVSFARNKPVGAVSGVILGALIGILSAYVGGFIDLTIQRIVDAMMAFPPIILALGLVAAVGGSANNIVIALVVILLPGTIRVIRFQVLSIKELDYTLAATAIGAGSIRIMLRHILPNVLASYTCWGPSRWVSPLSLRRPCPFWAWASRRTSQPGAVC